MGKFLDSGIVVTLGRKDAEGHDIGPVQMVLKEGRKEGVYLVAPGGLTGRLVRRFAPVEVLVYRRANALQNSVVGHILLGAAIAGPVGGVIGAISGAGKQDAWYMELRNADGTSTIMLLGSQHDGLRMKKRIERHLVKQIKPCT